MREACSAARQWREMRPGSLSAGVKSCSPVRAGGSPAHWMCEQVGRSAHNTAHLERKELGAECLTGDNGKDLADPLLAARAPRLFDARPRKAHLEFGEARLGRLDRRCHGSKRGRPRGARPRVAILFICVCIERWWPKSQVRATAWRSLSTVAPPNKPKKMNLFLCLQESRVVLLPKGT